MSIDDFDLKLPNGTILWFKTSEECLAAARVRDLWQITTIAATVQPVDCRSAFEVWATSLSYGCHKYPDGTYRAIEWQQNWIGFQAAWKIARPEREVVNLDQKTKILLWSIANGVAPNKIREVDLIDILLAWKASGFELMYTPTDIENARRGSDND